MTHIVWLHLTVERRTHFLRQFSLYEEFEKDFLNVNVFPSAALNAVTAVGILGQGLQFVVTDNTMFIPVTLVTHDNHRHLWFTSTPCSTLTLTFTLPDLLLKALHLVEAFLVVDGEDQYEQIACKGKIVYW